MLNVIELSSLYHNHAKAVMVDVLERLTFVILSCCIVYASCFMLI